MAAKMIYRDAGVLRTLRRLFFRDAGTLRTIRKAFYRDAGVLRMVFALLHTVSAPDINATFIGATPKASGTSHATVSGGVGPFTYSWAFIAGGTGITLTNTTSSTVTAQRSAGSSNFGIGTGTLRCSVTDTGNGGLVATMDVMVTLENSA